MCRQDERTQSALSGRTNYLCCVIPRYFIYHLNSIRVQSLEVAELYRCSQVDLGPLSTAIQVGNNEIIFRAEEIRVRKDSPPAIGIEITCIVSQLTLRDPVRIGQCE